MCIFNYRFINIYIYFLENIDTIECCFFFGALCSDGCNNFCWVFRKRLLLLIVRFPGFFSNRLCFDNWIEITAF